MAYISNSTQKPVKWGLTIPQNPKLPTPTFNTAQTTPATRGGTVNVAGAVTSATGGQSGPQSTLNTTTASTPQTAQTSTPPTTYANAPQPDLNGLITGLKGLSTGLQDYRTKGLLTPPTTAPTPTTPLSGFVGGLQDKSDPSRDQQAYLKQLARASERGNLIGEQAQQIANKYGSEINRVGQLGGGAVAGAKSTGTDVVGRGNAAIASESASNRINALSAALASELQGTQQQLTGAEQGITGLTNALQGANTQQQLGISALGTGGQLAMPSPAQYGQTVFDPTTGSYTSGGNMDPQVQAQNLAQQVISGAMTYDQALASLGYAGQAGTNFLNNAITGVGGNPLQLQAQGAGQQANVATQTTAGTDIARQGLGDATQQYVQLTNFAQAASQQASDLLNIMNTAEINGQPLIRANMAINRIAEEVSDPNIRAFQTSLQEARNLYARLLSTGGSTPTANDERALVALDGNSTPEATAAAIEQLESSVGNILRAQAGAMQQYQQNLGSGNGSYSGGSGSIWDW